MKSGLLLDAVVRESTSILRLFAGEDYALLLRRDSSFVPDLRFDIDDGVSRVHLQGDGLARQDLHKDLQVLLGGPMDLPSFPYKIFQPQIFRGWLPTPPINLHTYK